MPQSVRSMRAFFAVLVVGLLASACSTGATQNGVNVKTVATNLTYGVPKTPPPAAPANSNPIPSNPLPVVKIGGPIPTLPPLDKPPSELCPAAPLTVFPPPAPSSVEGQPLPGTYRWIVAGSQKVTGFGNIPLPRTSERKVGNVTSTSNGFSFTVEERELVFGSRYTVKTTYEVRKTGNQAQTAGVYITKLERINSSDSTASSTFAPSPPVLFLPTPTTVGASVNSVGIDPTTLEVLQVAGKVLSRKRVDACGTPVDTFYVHSVQSYASGGNTTRREYNYGVATILGGLPIVESVQSPCVDSNGTCQKDAVTFHMDAHIGQVKPSSGS